MRHCGTVEETKLFQVFMDLTLKLKLRMKQNYTLHERVIKWDFYNRNGQTVFCKVTISFNVMLCLPALT